MKLNIFYLIIIILITSCISNSQDNQDSKKPEISFKDSVYNFKSVDRGNEVKHSFIFTNTGDENLVVDKVIAGCDCTKIPYYSSGVIPPGDTGSVKIKLETAGLFGPQAKMILVRSNAALNKRKRLIVRAYVE